MELGASLRLFGGLKALHTRVQGQARADFEVQTLAWAPTRLGALALARGGLVNGITRALPPLLDRLPLRVLDAAQPHQPMLERLGCRHLGQVRALPRKALAQRFGPELLDALDQAYDPAVDAQQPQTWEVVPETFSAQIELPWRVEQAQALLAHAQPLLRQMEAWLAARQMGVLRFSLAWQHDALRPRSSGTGGGITVATAEPTRHLPHLQTLLAERLMQTPLAAPVDGLRLQADEVQALAEASNALFPELEEDRAHEPLHQLLERLGARLGAQCVREPLLRADHRPECMQHWQPCGPRPQAPVPLDDGAAYPPSAQPSWLIDPPLRLVVRQDQPQYQGPLRLLAGPQRLATGWWSSATAPEAAAARRDYYLAHSPRAGLLWIYLDRRTLYAPQWYLQGVFA
ncbi:DNA polymerase Y family protein [Inhella sp. 4Y17]|uniref:DNA polymerase Y family protein n=1 Tax=Inhella gelatinilytica TaxID=2795030 RepID=A0A931IZI2_9BURK|nr:DNA polymerase Y family protein [Inhella gelatinilytica]